MPAVGREMSAKDALAAHQRHLVRKVSQAMAREGLPPDLLTPSSVDTKFCGASGFPEAADSVAYDPAQGLLAVGTSDGRVVLIGRPGVECTLRSASRSPTRHLCFLPNRGALLRVTHDGDCQLFSATARRLLTSIWLQGDAIDSVAVLPGNDPYVLLGCESGNVRVVALLGDDGAPAAAARPAADLSLQPYQVLGQEVDGRGGVVAVAVAHLRDRPLLLLVHRQSGAIVWDVRAERILCGALDEEGEASKPTCACWVGERANCFALGYDDGSVLVYGVPPAALQGDPFKVIEPADAQLLMALRVAGRGVRAAAVRSLSFLPGGGDGGEDCLLVFGGQGEGEPDMLTLLPLAPQPDGDGGGRQVPWFGSIKGLCTMPAAGALSPSDPPLGLMILTEGGQLVVHELASWQPTPLTLPIQELPPITLSRLVPSVSPALLAEPGGSAAVSPRSPGGGAPAAAPASTSRGSGSTTPGMHGGLPQHALTLGKVRACSRRCGGGGGEPVGAAAAALADHWPFTGGEPAASLAAGGGEEGGGKRHPSALLFTGHRDGRVRVWDSSTQVPELLLTVPASAGQERLRAVTALEVCPFSGIVAVGHAGGDVRLYQFTDCAQGVHRVNLDETLLPYEHVGAQPAGFQYIMRYSAHSAGITALALATKLKLAAVADASGRLSLLDLLQPAQLFSTRALAQPVTQAVFGSHVVPGPTKEDLAVERVVLFLAGADSTVLMVGLDAGEPLGRPMRPKNASRPLALALLDASGIPLPLLHGQLVLHWARNNGPAGSAGAPADQAGAASRGTSSQPDDPALAAAAGRLSRLSLSERAGSSAAALQHTGSRRSTAAESARSWSRADSVDQDDQQSSVEVHELPSSDEDDLDSQLAAAVQAVEEEKRAKAKFKLPKALQGLQRPASRASAAGSLAAAAERGVDQPEQPASPGGEASSAASAAPAGGPADPAFDPVGALQEFYGGPGQGPASPGTPSSSAGLPSPLDGRGAAAAASELFSQADLVDYPYLIDGDPTPAAYLLLCCADYLRLYSTDNIRLGDRSTERKASFEAELVLAAPFMSVHGPGVASLDGADALQLHSLPGLAPLCRRQLDDSRALGFRWACQPLAAAAAAAAAGTPPPQPGCCSLDGQLLLAAPGNELARLALVADCALPAPPAAVYSTRVAQAAAAAAAARRQPSAGAGYPVRLEAPHGSNGGTAAKPSTAATLHAAPDGFDGVAAGAAKGFGRFFDQAASTVTGLATAVASTAVQELDKARVAGQSALQRLGAGEAPSRALPPLGVLFATPVEPLDDIDYMPEDEDAASNSGSAAAASGSGGPGAGALNAGAASAAPTAAGPPSRKGSASIVSPREAAIKLRGLLPTGRSKSERAELLERDAAAAAAAAPAGSAPTSARTPGGWAKEPAAGGPTVNRSASEIKRAYGRSGGSSKAEGVRGVMEQNRQMLAERGERLRALDERTAAMQDDAEDFASLARKLAEQQANKKWYQL